MSWAIGYVFVGVFLLSAFACNGPRNLFPRRGERGEVSPEMRRVVGRGPWHEKQFEPVKAAIPTIAKAEYVKEDELCATCHESYVKHHKNNIHREQSCEECHGPGSQHVRSRGEAGTILSFKTMKPAERSEACLKCHEKNSCTAGANWRTSAHAHGGVSCTDCHKSHYSVPPGTKATEVGVSTDTPAKTKTVSFQEAMKDAVDWVALREASQALRARGPQTCYRCHQQTEELQRIAHPHQILGPNGFDCKTCHDPHGNLKAESRTDLCLQCHKGHPTMAWKSSPHALHGVACVDCHNPHPSTELPRFLDSRHAKLDRPKRLPMSVQDPDVCTPCHQNISSQFNLPSHHPLPEGKMRCSSCHDAHGGATGNLKEPTVNMVCYKCHADKQGPFVYEHPPVSENCDICHNPHGTVANNLLKQPAAFLCLRCHAGHRGSSHTNIDQFKGLRPALYTDCTQCHAQVHGGDLPSPTRRGSRLQR
ncbi:MAG: DmsE family decaheme c-type cytochrome [Gemmataceae bacterium]